MTEDAITKAIAVIVGLYALKVAGEFFVLFLKRRLFDAPEGAEKSASTKLDAVASDIGAVKSDLRVLVSEMAGSKATVHEVRERVEGISRNYGERLGALEEKVVRLDERANVVQTLRQVLREEKDT